MQYKSKPIEVEAMKFDRTNGEEIAEWCGGEYTFIDEFDIPVIFINTGTGTRASHVGDFIVKEKDGFSIYYHDDFEKHFELIEK